jgi:hypothetical protein
MHEANHDAVDFALSVREHPDGTSADHVSNNRGQLRALANFCQRTILKLDSAIRPHGF